MPSPKCSAVDVDGELWIYLEGLFLGQVPLQFEFEDVEISPKKHIQKNMF